MNGKITHETRDNQALVEVLIKVGQELALLQGILGMSFTCITVDKNTRFP